MSSQPSRLLLVEDDARFAARLQRNLELEGFVVDAVADGARALERLRAADYDLVLSDIKMPGLDGLQLLSQIRQGTEIGVDTDVPVVMLTSMGSVDLAIEALRLRADDFLTKEQDRGEIAHRLRAVLERERARRETMLLQQRLAEQSEHGAMIAESPAMRAVVRKLQALASTDATVLLLGETGVGKDLAARYLHEHGPRADRPFCEVNCAALPDDNMFQSELFGHERGAFTGADQPRRGRFELAQGGTLFLDEIGELSWESQGKLLRAIETRRIERLGGAKTIEIDTRVIVATNRLLADEVRRGAFRRDLYYRINVVQIEIPPLRRRADDIQPLAEHFLRLFAQKYRRPARTLDADALALLRAHPWPGNVRELRNVMERLVLLGARGPVTAAELMSGLLGDELRGEETATLGVRLPPGGLPLEEIERQAILQALQHANWVQREAARLLDISPDRMNARVKKFGITHPSWRTQV